MLSDRLRPNIEAAPWVIAEVKKLEQKLSDAYLEMRKIRPAVRAIFDRAVWDRSRKEKAMLLTEQEIRDIARSVKDISENSDRSLILATEKAIIAKIKAQGPVAWRFDISEDSYNQKWGLTESGGLAKSSDPRAQPLYRLPEGDYEMKSLTEQRIMELAAQNQQFRICLDKLARLGNEPYLGNSFGNKIAAEALALPDLASHMLNRIKAEILDAFKVELMHLVANGEASISEISVAVNALEARIDKLTNKEKGDIKMNEQEKQKILEEFKTYGMDASFHYADDTGEEWKFAYPLVEKCMKLAKEHVELHTEMAEIAKHFIFAMSFKKEGEIE